MLYIVNISLLKSAQFSILFARHIGIDAHLKFLSNEILEKISNVSVLDFSNEYTDLIDFVVLNLSSMSKNFEDNSSRWVDSNCLDIMLNVARFKPSTQLDAYLTIANIATDKEIDRLTEIHKCTQILVEMIDKCAADFNNER